MSNQTTPSPKAARYWRLNLYLLSVLLPIWFLTSFALGIVWADALNRFSIGGFPVGFWISQQGAILVFIVLILVYAIAMGRLDREYNTGKGR